MKIKHYEIFKAELPGSRLDQETWGALRMGSDYAYGIEENAQSYEQNCMQMKSYQTAAKKICGIVKRSHCRHIITFGGGKGILEWHIKKLLPQVYLECTDYAKESIDKLKKVFLNCDALYAFDMLKGDYRNFDKKAFFIFYRVSEELNFKQWCQCLKKLYAAKIETVIFVPDELATAAVAKREWKKHWKNKLARKKDVFCGWIYSEETIEKIFRKCGYKIAEKRPLDHTYLYVLRYYRRKLF